LGGEVAYAWRKGEGKAQQGVAWSVGARLSIPRIEGESNTPLQSLATHITATCDNLGRIKTTYTVPLSDVVFASARYTVDMSSYRSNMAIGVESLPSPALPLMVKAKWDASRGLGLSLGAHLGLAAVMLSASYGIEGALVGLHFEL
jgi:hypothetical protein